MAKIIIKAVVDKFTCSYCKAMDGKVIDFDNLPVLFHQADNEHPCRCILIPYLEDEDG